MLWISLALICLGSFFFFFSLCPKQKSKATVHTLQPVCSCFRSFLAVPKGNVASVAPTAGHGAAGVTLDCLDVG